MKRFLIPGLALALTSAVSVGLAAEEKASGIDMTKSLPIGDSLLVMVTGMAIVFLGLTILIFLIKGLIKATDRMGKKKRKQQPQPAIPPVKAFDIRTDEPAAPETDDSLVAAITAAVMCVMEENRGFVVRRIRRI